MGTLLVFSLAFMAAWCLWGASPLDATRAESQQAPRWPQAPDAQGAELMRNSGALKRWGHQHGRSTEAAAGIAEVPLLLELLGTALDAGLTVQSALHLVAGVSEQEIREHLLRVVAGLEIGASWRNAWEGNLGRSDVAQIHAALSFGALTGAAVAPLLYAQAQHHRRTVSRQAEKRAAALGVKLVVPLGLCSLPAFIALGVVPVVMAMIPAL
ncbi:type II secretion system F family protein [Arthrobacter sp. TMN-49]